jgi:bifunctional non-homologous end joining protein LigD
LVRRSSDVPPSRRQYVAQPLPGFLPFHHPKLVATPPSGDHWLHEVKFDGYRMQVRVERGAATIYSRNGLVWTDRLPELAAAAAALPDCILDGELCVLDGQGRSDFSALRASLSPGKTGRLVFLPFDQLWRGQDDLRPFDLEQRKAILRQTLSGHLGSVFQEVGGFPEGGAALLEAACRLGLEGVVSKRRDSRYAAGKRETWVKAKCRPGQEVVIGGWSQAEGGAFKALLVGVYDDRGRFTYAGSVKTGFGARETEALAKLLRAIEQPASPFVAGDPPRKTREIHWAEPRLVANVEIAEWTASGKLRQASFQGLREDKAATDVRRETPAGGTII